MSLASLANGLHVVVLFEDSSAMEGAWDGCVLPTLINEINGIPNVSRVAIHVYSCQARISWLTTSTVINRWGEHNLAMPLQPTNLQTLLLSFDSNPNNAVSAATINTAIDELGADSMNDEAKHLVVVAISPPLIDHSWNALPQDLNGIFCHVLSPPDVNGSLQDLHQLFNQTVCSLHYI